MERWIEAQANVHRSKRLVGIDHAQARTLRALLLRTAMKEGLLGGTLDVSPRSESKEARLHVARWAGSESKEDRRLPAVGGGGDGRRVGLAAGRRGPAGARRARRHVGRTGRWRYRVDERRGLCPRPPRGARLGRPDR